jgi:CelD/BcsL family acetyltransferase involved in cellulose biosynthesis
MILYSGTMNRALQVDEIETPAGLEALREEWSALWERCPGATPFQAPEWLLPWRQHLGRGRLWVLALRQGDRLAGLAPFFVERYYGLPLRRVCLLGTGGTDYLDLLLEPGCAEEGARLVLDRLAERRARWEFCDFQQLRPRSPLLAAPAPTGLDSLTRPQDVCPVLTLPPTAAALPQALPPRLRANVRYYRRRLEREGEARFETADVGTLDELLEALFRLHQARWNRRLLPGSFRGARARRFHREAAAGFLARGWLRLHALRFRGTVRAALYCFTAGGRGYYYSGGFQPEMARFSPGTLLTAHALEDAVRAGAGEFDFLRGDEPYKYRWGAGERVNERRLLWHPSFPGTLAPPLTRLETRLETIIKRAARRLAARRG